MLPLKLGSDGKKYYGSIKLADISPELLSANLKLSTAGEVMGGHKVVHVASNGKVYLANNTSESQVKSILGMTNFSAVGDGSVYVVTSGIIKLQDWGLTVGASYYLTTNGNISATLPTTNHLIPIGVAISSNELEIRIGIPILRN
jgi:hypothetical protein